MKTYLLLTQDIIHPETRDTVFAAGALLDSRNVERLMTLGVDNFTCVACLAESYNDALIIAMHVAGVAA